MSMLWVAVLVIAGPTSQPAAPSGAAALSPPSSPSNSPVEKPAALRSGRALGEAVHAALKRWARANEKDADAAAREFLVLYKELRADTRLPGADRDELRAKVRGRLVRLSRMIAHRVARQKRLAQQQSGVVAKIGKAAGVLAQQAPAGAAGAAVAAPGPGGPNGADADYGQSLVDVIQTTIAPNTWDVNGGLGSIYYWRNQHALVIRATDEVHGFVGELLDQLDRAGH
jgi:hypothetical protein